MREISPVGIRPGKIVDCNFSIVFSLTRNFKAVSPLLVLRAVTIIDGATLAVSPHKQLVATTKRYTGRGSKAYHTTHIPVGFKRKLIDSDDEEESVAQLVKKLKAHKISHTGELPKVGSFQDTREVQ
jgi:hypothetical protein